MAALGSERSFAATCLNVRFVGQFLPVDLRAFCPAFRDVPARIAYNHPRGLEKQPRNCEGDYQVGPGCAGPPNQNRCNHHSSVADRVIPREKPYGPDIRVPGTMRNKNQRGSDVHREGNAAKSQPVSTQPPDFAAMS